MKISYTEFENWMINVYAPGQERYGQAFINHFHDKIRDQLPDPKLFYETNDGFAADIIMEKYVE
jgi:hypothetical protein